MSTLLSHPVFQLYAICSCVLVLILYGLGILTAKMRNERKIVVNHEDANIYSGAKISDTEHLDVLRIKRAHLNAIENCVPFFVTGFLYTQTNPSMLMTMLLFLVFVIARLLHAVFYLTARQPFRTLCFFVGAIINFIMIVQVVRVIIF